MATRKSGASERSCRGRVVPSRSLRLCGKPTRPRSMFKVVFCGRRAAAYLGAGRYRAANGVPITTIPVHIASITAMLQVTTAKEQFKLLDVSLVPIRALPVMPGSNRVARMPRLNYPAGQQHALQSGPNYVSLSEFGSWRRTNAKPRAMRPEMKGSSCLVWACGLDVGLDRRPQLDHKGVRYR